MDACTLAGTVEDVAARIVPLVQRGVNHLIVSPLAPDGDVEGVISSFAYDVMPRVRAAV